MKLAVSLWSLRNKSKHTARDATGLSVASSWAGLILKDRQPTVGANFYFTFRFNLIWFPFSRRRKSAAARARELASA
jgi:hypothetical protein